MLSGPQFGGSRRGSRHKSAPRSLPAHVEAIADYVNGLQGVIRLLCRGSQRSKADA